MQPLFTDYLEVFGSDERFFVFAAASVVLAIVLISFLRGSNGLVRLLFLCAAFLLPFAFVVLAPLSAISVAKDDSGISPVILNYNFGFLALGLGLFLKFRKLPARPQKATIN